MRRFLKILLSLPFVVALGAVAVYALGGLFSEDFLNAMTHGAHGVAMQRGLAG